MLDAATLVNGLSSIFISGYFFALSKRRDNFLLAIELSDVKQIPQRIEHKTSNEKDRGKPQLVSSSLALVSKVNHKENDSGPDGQNGDELDSGIDGIKIGVPEEHDSAEGQLNGREPKEEASEGGSES